MKILYAVQATGNGHISRSMELLPYLQQWGAVDLFLSGSNSTLPLSAPVKFRSKGLSLQYKCDGKLDMQKTVTEISPIRLLKEAMQLPVQNYDLIINDFECITTLACLLKRKDSVNFGHQASFQSSLTPRPDKKSRAAEWILKNYGKATKYVGLHFEPYDTFILPPVIKDTFHKATPSKDGYTTVYLPGFCDRELATLFARYKDVKFQIFSRSLTKREKAGNMEFIPVSKTDFNHSLLYCDGIITGAGFETPSEAIFLEKKLMAVPIAGQYEQECNAAALRHMGYKTLDKIDDNFPDHFEAWMNEPAQPHHAYSMTTADIVERMFEACADIIGKKATEPYSYPLPDLRHI